MSASKDDDKETLRIWFSRAIAAPKHFHLEKPPADERQGLASRRFFEDYQSAIESLGYKAGVGYSEHNRRHNLYRAGRLCWQTERAFWTCRLHHFFTIS